MDPQAGPEPNPTRSAGHAALARKSAPGLRFRRSNPMTTEMTITASLIAFLICCLLAAGKAQAQQADGLSDVAPRIIGSQRAQDRSLQKSTSKKTKTKGKRNASVVPSLDHEELPCPRATWKDDPVCADAPDEHTLPTPSTRSAASPQRDGAAKWLAPGAENVSVGAHWRANNNPRLPGYNSVPMVDSVKKTIPGSPEMSPDTHFGMGLDLNF